MKQVGFFIHRSLIGVGKTIDPTLTCVDRIVGKVLGEVGDIPHAFIEHDEYLFID